jgi:hypothetical protein
LQEIKLLERGRNAMSFLLDAQSARSRHEDMLREAEQIRLARRAAQANGTETLLSRMVKLLSRTERPAQGRSDGTLEQPKLADANVR